MAAEPTPTATEDAAAAPAAPQAPAPAVRASGIDAVLVLQRSDVPALVALGDRISGLPLLFIDPGALDAAVQAGLGHYALRRLDIDADLPAEAYTAALLHATRIDRELAEVRQELFGGIATPYLGWDQMLLYLSLQRAFMARAFGRAVAAQFGEQRLGLLRPTPAQLMNFDSMLSAEMAAADPRRFAFIGEYDEVRFHHPQMTQLAWHGPAIARLVADQGVDAVVHLATCFYDAQAFGGAVRERFRAVLDLPGTYCDVAVARPVPLLMRIADLPAAMVDPAAVRYRERAEQVFRRELATFVPRQAAVDEQARAWAERSFQQALNFLTLRATLRGRQPQFVLADHDTGMLGPLYSVAAELGSPITVLPHSGYVTSVLPHGRRVTAVERHGFGAAVRTALGQPVPVRPVRFRATPKAQPRENGLRVCLLLNTMSSEGISHVDFFPLAAFYRRLDALCTSLGAQLVVRLKPSNPALSVVATAFGQPPAYFQRTCAQPIETVAEDSDLTIAYGEMTSGVASFLDAASLVLHVSEQVWPADTLITPPYVRDGLIDSLDGEAGLARVASWLGDAEAYRRAQSTQSIAYARRCRGAHDTFFA